MSASSLTIVKNVSGGALMVSFVGQIDAGADYSSLQFTGVSKAVFNFQGINLINSAGIQKWVKFMESLPDELNIVFEVCPASIVNQINLFANFTGGKKVEFTSFIAPFFCEKCDEENDMLLKAKDIVSHGDVTVPTPPCPTCGTTMEFDSIEDKYFAFLKKG